MYLHMICIRTYIYSLQPLLSTLEELSTWLGLVEFSVNSAGCLELDGHRLHCCSLLSAPTLLLVILLSEKYSEMFSVVLGNFWVVSRQMRLCAVM